MNTPTGGQRAGQRGRDYRRTGPLKEGQFTGQHLPGPTNVATAQFAHFGPSGAEIEQARGEQPAFFDVSSRSRSLLSLSFLLSDASRFLGCHLPPEALTSGRVKIFACRSPFVREPAPSHSDGKLHHDTCQTDSGALPTMAFSTREYSFASIASRPPSVRVWHDTGSACLNVSPSDSCRRTLT
jgi:hypothetical protein